jgi:hypothetical protein
MNYFISGLKNLLEGLGVFFEGLAVVIVMAISYVILLVKKAIRGIGT